MTLVTLVSHILFFFNDTATTEIYTLSLHDALPIGVRRRHRAERPALGQHPLAAAHRVLAQGGRAQVPVHGARGLEPARLEARPGGGAGTGGAGRRRAHGHAGLARRDGPCARASTTTITAMFTSSFTPGPRCTTWTA